MCPVSEVGDTTTVIRLVLLWLLYYSTASSTGTVKSFLNLEFKFQGKPSKAFRKSLHRKCALARSWQTHDDNLFIRQFVLRKRNQIKCLPGLSVVPAFLKKKKS